MMDRYLRSLPPHRRNVASAPWCAPHSEERDIFQLISIAMEDTVLQCCGGTHTTTATSQPWFFSDACAATSKVGPVTSTNSDGFSWPPTAWWKTLPLFANPEKV